MSIEDLQTIMRCLRDPINGCAWDLRQNFASIAPHTLEEAYEVVDAIERQDMPHLRDELGDLLFQVIFYAQMGKESGDFDFDSIVESISEKLLSRHPHIFPQGTLESFGQPTSLTAEEVERNWEAIKTVERQQALGAGVSALEDVPRALPALNRARKLQKRAATVGFDWPAIPPVIDKVEEELAELRSALHAKDSAAMEEELGDLLFSAVNLARHLQQDPESTLRKANEKFEKRFRRMEQLIRESGQEPSDLDMATYESYWREAKRLCQQGPKTR